MGLFGFSRGPTENTSRPKDKRKRDRAGERQRAMERRQLKLMDAKTQLELKRMELELRRMNDDGEDHLNITVADLPRLNKSLAAAGFEIRPKNASNDSLQTLIESVPQIVNGLGPVLVSAQQQRLAAQAAQSAPAVLPVPSPGPAAPAPAPTPEPTREESTEVNWVVGYIKAQLSPRDPEQAAAWIKSQSHPYAADLVAMIQRTPDSRVFASLDEQAKQAPDFRPLVDWLKQRGEWTLQVCHHLRDATPSASESPGGSGSVF